MSTPASGLVHVPPSGPDAVWCTLFHRDAAFTALAEAELQALGGGAAAEPGVWLSPSPIRWATCGYGIAGGRQLAHAATLDELVDRVRALGLAAPTFDLAVRRIPWRIKGATAAKARLADVIDGQVSVDDPALRLVLVVSTNGFRVLLEDEVPPDAAAWLGTSQKPHNYLVALPVRIGKAMLNLTARAGDSVLDPFCGTGTIPILSAWAGHPTFASDISEACVEKTGENLAHFGLRASLACVDAGVARQAADCIVTNLPYGLYSHTAPLALGPILAHLATLAPRITVVTSERIEDALGAAGLAIERIIAAEPERFERLVYVTRRR